MKTLYYSCKCGASWEGSSQNRRCQSCGERSPTVSRHPPKTIPLPAGARVIYRSKPENVTHPGGDE